MAAEAGTRRRETDAYGRGAPALGPQGAPLPPGGGVAAGGAAAGLFAGLLMILTLSLWSASMGQGFWTPLELMGGALTGLRSVLGGFWSGALGVLLHFATAAAWGAGFAALVSLEMTPGQAFWAGLLYGASVWAVMTWIGLPVLDRTLLARLGMMEGAWFFAHLVYGAALCVTPGLRRRISEDQALLAATRPAVEEEDVLTV